MIESSTQLKKGLGVLVLDDENPQHVQMRQSADRFDFPLQHAVVADLTIEKLVSDKRKILHLPAIHRAAKELEKMGCRAIVGEGGYFAHFQREVAASIQIPVLISILHLLPIAQRMVGLSKDVGVLTANAQYLTELHLESVGMLPDARYIIGSTQNDFGILDVEEARAQFLRVAVSFVEAHPNMAAIILEYAGFTPYAQALRDAITIPVLDWHTFLHMVGALV